MVLSRAAVVYLLVPMTARFGAPIPSAWRHAMVWGGLRGSLSMVLILTLPDSFPDRELLVAMVFGTVAASLFFQGPRIGPVVMRLGVVRASPMGPEYERARGRALAARHAAEELEEATDLLDPDTADTLSRGYRSRSESWRSSAAAIGGTGRVATQLADGLRIGIEGEREAIREAAAQGEAALRRLVEDLATRRTDGG